MAFAHRHQALTDIGTGTDIHAQTITGMLMHNAPFGTHQDTTLCFITGIEIHLTKLRTVVDHLTGIRL